VCKQIVIYLVPNLVTARLNHYVKKVTEKHEKLAN